MHREAIQKTAKISICFESINLNNDIIILKTNGNNEEYEY